jgi:uncharacterized protein (TIGR03437 family)
MRPSHEVRLPQALRLLAVFALACNGAFAQGPTIAAVVDPFTYGKAICPGGGALIYGTNLGSSSSTVTVTVGGKAAYVYTSQITSGQMLVELPVDAPVGNTTLTVTVNGAASTPFNITLATYAPALLTAGSSGSGPGFIFSAANTPITYAAPAHPGDTLTTYATGLGPTNPATPTGVAAATAQTATTPTLTIGGVGAKVVFAGVTKGGGGGVYQVNFTVPSTGVQGTQPMAVSIGGASDNGLVTVPVLGLSRLVNNATFGSAGTAAPGSIVSVFANGLASTDQLTGFPSTKFQGVQVTFNGTPAPMFHLVASTKSEQQIDLLVPTELPTSGTVNVQLTTSTALNPNYTLKMVPASPGLYRIADPSVKTRSNVIAQFSNTAWLAMPASMTTALQLPACTPSTPALGVCGQPATIGDYLSLYVTGLGLATPNGDPSGKPLATGSIPPTDGSVLYETPTKPTVTVGGIAVTNITFSGLTPGYPGEYVIVFQVPSGVTNGDDIPVVITMGGLSDTATISIQPR